MFLMKLTIELLTLIAPCIIGVVVGATLILHVRSLRHQAKATALWPVTVGRVSECQIVEIRQRSRRSVYRTAVTYEYEIKGIRYRSHRRFFGEEATGGPRSQAEQLCQKYHPGSEVTVYYNPDKPAEAVLELVVHNTLGWMTAFGVLLVSFGLLMGTVILISTLHTCRLIPSDTPPVTVMPNWCRRFL